MRPAVPLGLGGRHRPYHGACGTYQAFVCYAIGLFLFDCLIRLLEGEAIPQVVARGVRYVLICVISLVLYYVVLQVMLAVTGTALDDYQGVGGIGLSSIAAFLARFQRPGCSSGPVSLIRATSLPCSRSFWRSTACSSRGWGCT